MTEMDKLEQYLKAHGITYERNLRRIPGGFNFISIEQIIAYDNNRNRTWDAVCSQWSYGGDEGLLEIMGDIVPPDAGDSVEGWLTAQDVIERIERNTEL